MTAYNPIATLQRLEGAGMERKQAEALADEMRGAIVQLVTQEQLEAALNRQTIKLGLIVVGAVTFACTVLGVVLSH
ncbi:MAG: hypothetical protein DI547_05085 [Sphingobium sp.]|nr:MAG: hypothetical protein DI547_05085 [Sphingobium sp.]